MPTPKELLEKLEERFILGEISEGKYDELKAKLLARIEPEKEITTANTESDSISAASNSRFCYSCNCEVSLGKGTFFKCEECQDIFCLSCRVDHPDGLLLPLCKQCGHPFIQQLYKERADEAAKKQEEQRRREAEKKQLEYDKAIQGIVQRFELLKESTKSIDQISNEVLMPFPDALDILHSGSQRNEPIICLLLGRMYLTGYRVEKDELEGFRLIKLAAESGQPIAQCLLGSCYYAGTGVTSNETDAMKWFSEAAAAGVVEAQYNFGRLIYRRKDTSSSSSRALEWLKKAAEKGHSGAINELKEIDYRQRSEVAERGDAEAKFQFAEYLLYIDKDRAELWYRNAADLGHTEASYKIAQIYRDRQVDYLALQYLVLF